MRKLSLILFALCFSTSLFAQSSRVVEQGSFEVVANAGSRITVVKVFFSKPFKSMPKQACVADFSRSGLQHTHGEGEVQDYSLMWVQIIAEVGEKVNWSCKGER